MNLTIYPVSDPVAFVLFGFPVHWYGVVISSAIFIGLIFAYLTAKKRYSIKEAEIFCDFAPVVIIYSVLGARLFYVLGDFRFYFNNPLEIPMINHGGLSVWGGIFFGILTLYFYSKRYKFETFKYPDIFALFMPLCQAIGRWGNYFNSEAYGKPFNGAVKLFVDESHRYPQYKNVEFYHPTFLYEMILDFILFIILFSVFKKSPKHGTITALYFIGYSIIRITVEYFRLDSVINIASIPVATLISVIGLVFGIALLVFIYRFDNKPNQ